MPSTDRMNKFDESVRNIEVRRQKAVIRVINTALVVSLVVIVVMVLDLLSKIP